MIIESSVDGKSWGDIAVDDIKVLEGVGLTDCKGEATRSLLLLQGEVCRLRYGFQKKERNARVICQLSVGVNVSVSDCLSRFGPLRAGDQDPRDLEPEQVNEVVILVSHTWSFLSNK